MRGKVVVEEETAFQAWLQEQPTFAQSMAEAGTGTKDRLKVALSAGETESQERGITQ